MNTTTNTNTTTTTTINRPDRHRQLAELERIIARRLGYDSLEWQAVFGIADDRSIPLPKRIRLLREIARNSTSCSLPDHHHHTLKHASAMQHAIRIYFGRSIPRQHVPHPESEIGVVSALAFDDFTEKEIATRFHGWTFTDARGGWTDAETGEIVVEYTTILETWATDAGYLQSLERARHVAQSYAKRFAQDCVAVYVVEMVRPVEFLTATGGAF